MARWLSFMKKHQPRASPATGRWYLSPFTASDHEPDQQKRKLRAKDQRMSHFAPSDGANLLNSVDLRGRQ